MSGAIDVTRGEFNDLLARVAIIEANCPEGLTSQPLDPYRVAHVLEPYGFNCFPDDQDQAGAGNTPESIIAAATFLTGGVEGAGLTCRFYEKGTRDRATVLAVSRAMRGVRWVPCIAQGGTVASIVEVAEALRAANALAFVGSLNEPNMLESQGGTEKTSAQALAIQTSLYNHFHPRGVRVASPSCADKDGNYLEDYWGTNLTALTAVCDITEGHHYPNSGASNRDMWRRTGKLVASGMPPTCTIGEYDGGLYNTGTPSADLKALWAVCSLITGALYYQMIGFQAYSLYDYQNIFAVGLFENGDPTQPTPTAWAIHNLFAVCGDGSRERRRFTKRPLQVEVTGMPASWTENQGAVNSGGGQWMFLQDNNGNDYVLMQNQQDALSGSTDTVTVKVGQNMATVDEYLINGPTDLVPVPANSYTNVSTVQVDLATEMRVLKMRRAL